MSKYTVTISLMLLLMLGLLRAQMLVPKTENVYGGRMSWIATLPVDSQTTRIFVSTESPNSMFYADIVHTTPIAFGTFNPVPDFDGDDGFGQNVHYFVVDSTTGYFVASILGQLYVGNEKAGSRKQIETPEVTGLGEFAGTIFYTKAYHPDTVEFHMGTLDPSSGMFLESGGSPFYLNIPGIDNMPLQLYVNPVNKRVYFFVQMTPIQVWATTAPYDSLTNSSAVTAISLPSLSGINFTAFGIAPDGRLFLGSEEGTPPAHFKFIAYSDDEGASWDTVGTGIGGTSSGTFAFAGDSSQYTIYFGTGFSPNKGYAGSWHWLGERGFMTHPNDGSIAVDPHDPAVVYLTSDLGLAASVDSGYGTFEIVDGIEAVKVWDLEMDTGNSTGWVASKSGIRKVENYGSSSESWDLFYPMGDGAPYTSIAVDPQHPDTAYAGNMRLYRTVDGGMMWDRVFEGDDPALGFSWNSFVADVEVNPESPRFVILGVNSPESGVRGGIFVSKDYGTTWDQIDTDVYNTEVHDIVVNPIGGDSAVFYVGCDYVHDGTTSSYGVKTLVYSPTADSFYFDNDMVGESGTLITNFGAMGLAVDTTGNVFACGVNSNNEPRAYMKEADSTFWMMLPTNGLPPYGEATAITVGESYTGQPALFMAVEHQIYYLEKDSVAWKIALEYPVGTEINVLYWDELMVGMSTGLKSYQWDAATAITTVSTRIPQEFALHQNYPNPFNPATTIAYRLPVSAQVELSVYNVRGQRIQTLVQEFQQAGRYAFTWQANVPSGIYFYRITARSAQGEILFNQTRKMMLIK